MALSENRQVMDTNIDLSVSGTAERGGILSFVPWANGLAYYAPLGAVSGNVVSPAGLLLDDVEALNFFTHPDYRQRNVVPRGSVVGVATEGEFETDFVEQNFSSGESAGTYAPGDRLYLADAGQVSRNIGTTMTTAGRRLIGRALSTVGSTSFIKIRIDI